MIDKIQILHLEDNPGDAELILIEIQNQLDSAKVVQVADKESFSNAIKKGAFDVVLSDYNVPGFKGTEALDIVREKSPDCRFISLSGAIGEERAVEMLKKGAVDYVQKDNLGKLVPAIKRAIREKQNEKEKTEARIRMMKYQSMLLSSQLNPHFIFNALNSVQYYILDEDKQHALNFISEFASLMRSVLDNSRNQHISIRKEVSFLERYLELEKQRFRDKFEYSIEVGEGVDLDDLYIPPMLLQPFIENSVIHGVGPLEKQQGHINIRIDVIDDLVHCVIQDNGVGRKKAEELKKLREGDKDRKSLGMGITNTRLSILNDLYEDAFKVDVEDIEDIYVKDGISDGTKIYLRFPQIRI